MMKKCVICDRKLSNYNKEGVCSICRKKAKSIINIPEKVRSKNYSMYDSLKELETNVILYGNSILKDDINMNDIAISLLSIIENVNYISSQCKLNLNLYKNRFKEVINNGKKE